MTKPTNDQDEGVQEAVKTYWNGEETPCRRVLVRVGTCSQPSFWHHGLEGTERRAVEVSYYGETYLLDDEDGDGSPDYSSLPWDKRQLLESMKSGREARHGDGWRKVTIGEGAPFGPYAAFRSLPNDSVVLRELTPEEVSHDD